MYCIHLLNTFKPGGAENVALNYAVVLKELGMDSYFVAKDRDGTYKDVINKTGKTKNDVCRKFIANARIIFIHSNKNLFVLMPYIIMLKIKKIRVVYIQHLYYNKFKFIILSFIINNFCTDFIQITPKTSELVKKYITIKKHFIVNFHINKYVDIEEINKIRIKIRNELHIQQNKKLVMFSAVFKKNKGLADFLRLAKNHANNSEYLFLLIGDGEEAGLINKFNLSNVIWLGFVNNVEDYLLASDMYIFTSLFEMEMMPVALIEAINCDRTILAYNTEINKFLLNHKNICNTFNELNDKLDAHRFAANHKKYDKKYGMEKLRDLLQIISQ